METVKSRHQRIIFLINSIDKKHEENKKFPLNVSTKYKPKNKNYITRKQAAQTFKQVHPVVHLLQTCLFANQQNKFC